MERICFHPAGETRSIRILIILHPSHNSTGSNLLLVHNDVQDSSEFFANILEVGAPGVA